MIGSKIFVATLTLMLLLIGFVSASDGQTKIVKDEQFTAPTSGWFLTDSQLLDLDLAVRERDLLAQKAGLADSLVNILDRREAFMRDLIQDQHELIKDLSSAKTPGLWDQATDRGTLAAIAILGAVITVGVMSGR